jgi:hypothetical protein
MQQSLTGKVAAAVQQLESITLERTVATRSGDLASVHQLDLRAAGIGCATMDKVLEELKFSENFDELMPPNVDAFLRGSETLHNVSVEDSNPPSPQASETMDLDQFLNLEVYLLEIAGLSERLAADHVVKSLRQYRALDPRPAPTSQAIFTELNSARDKVCARFDELLAAKRLAEREGNRRRRLKLLTSVIGGTLIVAANTAATAMVFPPAAAASVALGSGAVGSIAALFT